MLKRVMVVVLLGCIGLTAGVAVTGMGGQRYVKTAEILLRPNSDASHIVAMTKSQHPGVRVFAHSNGRRPTITVSATGSPEGAFNAVSTATTQVIRQADGHFKSALSSFETIQQRPLGNPVHYGMVGLLAGLSAALGFLVPPRSRLTRR